MSIALHPSRMTAGERLDEVAALMAAGAKRLLAKDSAGISARSGASFLDFAAGRSGHEPPANHGSIRP